MITLILILASTACAYTFPESPYYYDYDMRVVDGIVAFVNPNNVQLEYHFCGYGNNVIELYGQGTVEIYHRGTLYDVVYVPEPISLILLGSGIYYAIKETKDISLQS